MTQYTDRVMDVDFYSTAWADQRKPAVNVKVGNI